MEQQAGSEHPGASPSRPSWLWWGTRGSADRGTLSLLALAETLAATAVSAYVALRYGTFFLELSACLAPLLLLRTPASQALGLQWGPRAIESTFVRIEYLLHLLPDTRFLGPWLRILVSLLLGVAFVVLMSLGFVVIALTAPCVRFTATLVTFLRTPLQCLGAIPRNWWRNVACVDMTHVPELLPGIDAIIDSRDREQFILLLHPWRAASLLMVRERWKGELPSRLLRGVVTAMFLLIVALPAWLYRWFIKASCLSYVPLAWIVRR